MVRCIAPRGHAPHVVRRSNLGFHKPHARELGYVQVANFQPAILCQKTVRSLQVPMQHLVVVQRNNTFHQLQEVCPHPARARQRSVYAEVKTATPWKLARSNALSLIQVAARFLCLLDFGTEIAPVRKLHHDAQLHASLKKRKKKSHHVVRSTTHKVSFTRHIAHCTLHTVHLVKAATIMLPSPPR